MNGGAFQRGGTFNISYVQTDTALEVVPKYYYVNVTLFGTDNVLSRGPEAAMNYVESKLINASGKMAKNLGTDIFLDGTSVLSGTINLDGFTQAIDHGYNYASYGGITRTDLGVANGTCNAGLNAYMPTATTGALATFTMAAMQTAYGACWFGNEHIDLVVTTQAIWNIIWNKILPQQRFMEESTDLAKIGFGKRSPLTGSDSRAYQEKSDELLEPLSDDSEGNQQPSIVNGKEVAVKVQRLAGEEPTNNPANSVRHESDDIVHPRRNTGKGVQSMRWNGASICVDQYCPSGTIWGLNEMGPQTI